MRKLRKTHAQPVSRLRARESATSLVSSAAWGNGAALYCIPRRYTTRDFLNSRISRPRRRLARGLLCTEHGGPRVEAVIRFLRLPSCPRPC